jgi:hypothetical protein
VTGGFRLEGLATWHIRTRFTLGCQCDGLIANRSQIRQGTMGRIKPLLELSNQLLIDEGRVLHSSSTGSGLRKAFVDAIIMMYSALAVQ